ncbi:MAG: hypothetical protein ABID04_02425 [Patescibacteria group bacterium]
MADFDSIRSSDKAIESHVANYYQRLFENKEVPLSSLLDSYRRMKSSLHRGLDGEALDLGTLSYVLARLPETIFGTKKVVLASSLEIFQNHHLTVKDWQRVSAKARRRLMFFNPNSETLACLINSDSDIDDLVNCLLAFNLEWQKLAKLKIGQAIPEKLKNILGEQWQEKLLTAQEDIDLTLLLLPETREQYQTVVGNWWQKASDRLLIPDWASTPVYFVSSNQHSLVNLIGGFVQKKQNEIFNHISQNYPDLDRSWDRLLEKSNQIRVNDFLYYISSKYFQDNYQARVEKQSFEKDLGIKQVNVGGGLPSTLQLIPVSALARSEFLDPQLKTNDLSQLAQSRAQIINIDYPLGQSAGFLLSQMLKTCRNLRGIYILGKAAILTGSVGDIQIPRVVFDERTGNIFRFKNSFDQLAPFRTLKTEILSDQKAVSVLGTFLENENQLEKYLTANFNIIEMESGPYLTALTESVKKVDQPKQQLFHLDNLPFDLGIINYASDNPLSKSLAEGSMALAGIEPTYLASLSIVQRIIDLEKSSLF